jgi:hypothetical protein
MTQPETPEQPPFRPAAIAAELNRHHVRYVVIGAFAAIAQHAPIPATRDIDITPDNETDNLSRLSQALTDLGAKIRTEAVPEGLPFGHNAASLAAADTWNLICDDGEFDISFHPSGFTTGYSQLAQNAHRIRVAGTEVMVADLADIIRSKEAAGRPKDLQVLPLLYHHQAIRSSEHQAELG